jgi:hypothetical protein
MRVVIIAILVMTFSIHPCVAKCVSLDIQNANRKIDSQLKPYCIDLRKRIEHQWEKMDQHVGEPIEVAFKVAPDGSIDDYIGVGEKHKQAQTIAAYAIKRSGPFSPLPTGQDELFVIAKFKSEPVRSNRSRITASELGNATGTALFVAAAGALVGFSIWALCKYGTGGTTNTNQSSSDYEWVNWPHTRSDGTYSPGYWRSRANGTMLDNFSTAGNINPFTGQPGWINP